MSTGRLLIIDDDPMVLAALPEMFRLWMPGLMVDQCGSARMAIDRIETTDYDAVISDIRLPDMDGLALLEQIKSCRPHTPVLLVTGYGDQTLATQALRGGAFDYILKPIDREYFLSSLTRALQLRHVSRQAEERERAETALRENRQSLDTLIETVPCILALTDRDGCILFFNRAAEELTGYTRDEILNTILFQTLVPADAATEVRQRYQDPISVTPYQVPWKTKYGPERLIEWRSASMRWPNQEAPCVLSVGIDITDRRRSEEKIAALHTELNQQVQAYEKVVLDLEASREQLQEKIVDLETFQDVVVGRELKMIALEKETAMLQRELDLIKAERPLA